MKVLFAVALLFAVVSSQSCVDSVEVDNVPLFFFQNFLGTYNISLSDTLSATQEDLPTNQYPYYKKEWTGDCPGGLDGPSGSCIEFTVYPNDQNFAPPGIMQKIESVNNGNPDRGEVRILTDSSITNYVYTTDHEADFCGPYSIQNSLKSINRRK